MLNVLSNNWENYFGDHPSNETSNKTMADLFLSFGVRTSAQNCMNTAIAEQETVFMIRSPLTNHIMFLHHFTKLGGTRTMPISRLFALVGAGPLAYPAHVSQETLFVDTEVQVPTWAHLTDLADADEINDLVANISTRIRPICPLPPFLAAVLLDQGGMSIPALIMTALARIRSFDEEHADDNTFPSADTHCKPIIHWLMAANGQGFGAIAAIPSIDTVIQTRSKEIHEKAIHSAETIINPVNAIGGNEAITQLASNVLEQTSVLEKLNTLAEESNKGKKKGIESIHPSFKKMILAASSTDGVVGPFDPVDQCAAFFNQKSAIHAKIHLLHTLQNEYFCAVDVTVPLATALYHGNFLWDKPDSPNNFSCLLFGKPSPLASTGFREAMVLHLKAEKGGGWSDKELERALKQAITIPTRVDSMIHSIHNFASASKFFFGGYAIVSVGLLTWRPFISSNLILFESQAAVDPTFIAKVLVAIDTRVNCWLSECCTKDLRCNIDDSLVDFTDMQRQIKTRQFAFSLPPSIRNNISNTPNRKNPEDNDHEEKPGKRQPIHNPNLNRTWKLKDGEDYRKIFVNAHVSKRPTLKGVNICPRWHVKGVCFTGCNLEATHIPITDPTLVREMNVYCQMCRENF